MKLYEYFDAKKWPKCISFSQETCSSVESEKQWSDEFNGNLYCSHGKANFCVVLIDFLSDMAFTVKAQVNDCSSRILILETEIDGMEYGVNVYSANTEFDELKTLTLFDLLNKFDHFLDKNIIIAGNFDLFFSYKLESHGGNLILKKHSIYNILQQKDIWSM